MPHNVGVQIEPIIDQNAVYGCSDMRKVKIGLPNVFFEGIPPLVFFGFSFHGIIETGVLVNYLGLQHFQQRRVKHRDDP